MIINIYFKDEVGGKIKFSYLYGVKGYKGNEIKLIYFMKVFWNV